MKKLFKILGIFIGISFVLAILGVVFAVFTKDEDKAEVYYNKAIESIEKKDIDSTNFYLDKSITNYSYSVPENVLKLKEKLNKINDTIFIKNNLIKMSDEEFDLLLSNKYESSFSNIVALNEIYHHKLNDFADERGELVEEQKLKKEKEKRKKRTKLIEDQFSYGRHIGLEIFIKDNMNDPNSYEHIETRYIDEGNYLVITKKFRGKNKLGGLVINTVKAKVDFKGNVIEIISQN
ncbi:MAG: hypothetical protein LAT51_10800 [Flavobacteriaceae bacterium]|nr:hypothetical protein [Flavobacteriaceae bacterium]